MAVLVTWDPENKTPMRLADGTEILMSPNRDLIILLPILILEATKYIAMFERTDAFLVRQGIAACPRFPDHLSEVVKAVQAYLILTRDPEIKDELTAWELSGIGKCDARALSVFGYAMNTMLLRSSFRAYRDVCGTDAYKAWSPESLLAIVREPVRRGVFERAGAALDRWVRRLRG
jgi:hypothetical protein